MKRLIAIVKTFFFTYIKFYNCFETVKFKNDIAIEFYVSEIKNPLKIILYY
jgi:hypothetical protein